MQKIQLPHSESMEEIIKIAGKVTSNTRSRQMSRGSILKVALTQSPSKLELSRDLPETVSGEEIDRTPQNVSKA